MKDYVQRMYGELAELSERIDKLDKFLKTNPIVKTLSAEKRTLMSVQLQAMKTYYKVLNRRIEIEEEEENG